MQELSVLTQRVQDVANKGEGVPLLAVKGARAGDPGNEIFREIGQPG
jgi:hypothetical protein